MRDYSKARGETYAISAGICGKVEAGDPQRIRYGCFVPDLTRLASATPADFRGGYRHFPGELRVAIRYGVRAAKALPGFRFSLTVPDLTGLASGTPGDFRVGI